MSLPNRSQVWVEAMLLVFLFAVAITFIGISSINSRSALFKQDLVYQAKKTLEMISGRINTVLFEGDGFSSNMVLPEKIRGAEYNVYVRSDFAVLEIGGMNLTSRIFAKEISGSFKQGENWVNNNNGTIYIS